MCECEMKHTDEDNEPRVGDPTLKELLDFMNQLEELLLFAERRLGMASRGEYEKRPEKTKGTMSQARRRVTGLLNRCRYYVDRLRYLIENIDI